MELSWDAPEDRVYQTGLDKGVFATDIIDAEAWNGLVSVEIDNEIDTESTHFGGVPIHDLVTIGSVSATLEAYSTPSSFTPYGGEAKVRPGIYISGQPPKRFNFSYRTLIGDEQDQALGYKLHFIYNAIAQSDAVTAQTVTDETEPVLNSWKITTAPSDVGIGYHPSSHLVLDSRFIDPSSMLAVEALTYGDAITIPSIRPIDQLVDLVTA